MKNMDFQNGIFIVLCLTICNTVLVTTYVVKMRVGCDNKSLTLDCRNSSYPIINLKQATLIFVTPSRVSCTSPSHTVAQSTTNCSKEDVLKFMQSKCNGKRFICTFLVRSREIGNHCEGVLNFRVIYKCMADTATTPKTANVRTTAQDTPPTRQATVNPTEKPRTVEKDYKTTTVLPSLSVGVLNHDRISLDEIFAAKVTPRFETSQIPQLHTATKHKFPATPSSEEDWGDTLDPDSKTSTRLKITFLTSCAKLVPIPSESPQKPQISEPKESNILTTPKVGKGRNNGGSRLSAPAFLGKLAFVCMWFTTMLFYV